MAFSTAFSEAWINANVKVFGKRLYPLSLRHLLWLNALESPFALALDGALPATTHFRLTDLRVFVAVCSANTDEQINANLRSVRYRYAGWSRIGHTRAWMQTLTYIKDHATQPAVLDVRGSQRLLGAPWILRVVTKLCRNGLGTEDVIWNMPVGKAIWYSACCDELDGGLLLGDNSFEEFLAGADVNP